MRHYDRGEFRHLDDAQRYRDHEYRGDDAWVGPNEHPPETAAAPAAPPRPQVEAKRAWRPPPRVRERVYRGASLALRVVDALRHPGRTAGQAVRTLVHTLRRGVTRVTRLRRAGAG